MLDVCRAPASVRRGPILWGLPGCEQGMQERCEAAYMYKHET